MATLHLLVGLPASGKTTEAKRLASSSPMLRMTPDAGRVDDPALR